MDNKGTGEYNGNIRRITIDFRELIKYNTFENSKSEVKM